MPNNDPSVIDKIAARVGEIQKSYVCSQEQLKHSAGAFDRSIDEVVLRIIDILDMIDTAKLTTNASSEDNSTAQLVIKKIEKRLTEIIRRWQVQEITFNTGKVEPGKVRVLETRKTSSEIPAATIIEICRKGYQRGDKVIRPADVITAD